MCKAKGYIEQINSIFEQVKVDIEHYKKELSRLDLTEQDLLHFIEAENFSASRGYCLAKQIKEVREERRKIKNELETLYTLYEKFINNNDKKVISIKQSITAKDKYLSNLAENKIYNPRVLKEAK